MKKREITIGTVDIGKKEKKYVNEVLDSTYITQGKYVKKFEKMVAKEHGKRFGVFVSSGQNALELALRTMIELKRIPRGGRVLVPAMTYSATINAVRNCELKPFIKDVNNVMELKQVSKKFLKKNKISAIIPVHLFGGGMTYEGHGLPIIEDACESIFNPKVGFGDITCTSFFASHSICTGEGGMCMTDNDEVYEMLKVIRYHGRDLDEKDFVFTNTGTSFKSTEMNAAMGVAQMERKDELMKKRLSNGEYLENELSEFAAVVPLTTHDDMHNFFMFPLMYLRHDKVAFMKYLNDNGIHTRSLLPIINQEAYNIPEEVWNTKFPNAQNFMKYGFYIGVHTKLTNTDLKYIIKVFKEWFDEKDPYLSRC